MVPELRRQLTTRGRWEQVGGRCLAEQPRRTACIRSGCDDYKTRGEQHNHNRIAKRVWATVDLLAFFSMGRDSTAAPKGAHLPAIA